MVKYPVMKYFPTVIAAVLLVLYPGNVSADSDGDVPLIYALMPGGTHFYEGDASEGAAFAAAELSFLAGGIAADNKLESGDPKELNVPIILSGQIYAIDKWRYFQKKFIKEEMETGKTSMPFDTTPLSELLLAPFDPDDFLSPIVLAFAALGVIDGIAGYPWHGDGFSDVRNVRSMGNGMSRDTGTAVYEASAFGLSWGAATSEEMLFRGLLMPALDKRYGKKTGLFTSSLIFGSLHLTNTDIDDPGYHVAQATFAGYIFGRHVQNNNYRLSKTIAAHFWYNFVSMTTTWLVNPRENPLGMRVGFAF